jgi:hypothetical protein
MFLFVTNLAPCNNTVGRHLTICQIQILWDLTFLPAQIFFDKISNLQNLYIVTIKKHLNERLFIDFYYALFFLFYNKY